MTDASAEAIFRRHVEGHKEGRRAALAGLGYGDSPYSSAQGSQTRVEAAGWRAGFQAGEIEQAEGAHFRTK